MPVRAFVLFTAFAALASQQTLAAPPAAPDVTVGAENRQLLFDWDAVSGATSYRLWFKMDRNSAYVAVGGALPASQLRARVNISVHKLNWVNARYKLAACNADGCTNSAELSVRDLMLDAIGYFKASNTQADDQFGHSIALSADGKTLVVAALNEDSGATGVNGNPADNSVTDSGAVYVYRRGSNGWRQEAYLKPDIVNPGQYFGHGWPLDYNAIGVNADGTLIAVGAGSEMENGYTNVGKVYVFGRASNGSWSQIQKLGSPAPIARDFLYYGVAVDMSDDGNTLRVLELKERDGEGNRQGEHHIYTRSGNTFVYSTTLTIPHNEVDFCNSGKLSADGGTFVQYCYSYGPEKSRVVTWKRGTTGWQKQAATVLVLSVRTEEVALSADGGRLAFADSPRQFAANVRVFSWSGAAWVEDPPIEPPYGGDGAFSTWGRQLAFDHTGNTLAISDFSSVPGGAGVSDTFQTAGARGGAVLLYARTSNATNPWVFRKQVKAPNAEYGDGFGQRLAFCGTGNALAIGAPLEASAATGVDGNQLDNSAPNSGAVYLY